MRCLVCFVAGMQRKMKTVAELEADMHHSAPHSPSTTPHSTPAPVLPTPPPSTSARMDDGDQSAFNRLLSLVKAGGGQQVRVGSLGCLSVGNHLLPTSPRPVNLSLHSLLIVSFCLVRSSLVTL